jgi:hypothetical protein
MIWPDGPREWSPRMNKSLKCIDAIKRAVPPELVVERWKDWITGETFPVLSRKAQYGKVVLMLHFTRPPFNGRLSRVWLYSDGSLVVGRLTWMLLNGKMLGYEHLKGRWPWQESEGPMVAK